MKVIRSPLQDIKYIPTQKHQSIVKTEAKIAMTSVLKVHQLPQRNKSIEWLYRSQLNLHYSRSTMFLAVGLLDQLLVKGLLLTEDNFELVSGSLLLICSKFNEVYPVTIRKINILSNDEFSQQRFIETEASILQSIDFTINPDSLYVKLADLQSQYLDKEGQSVQQLVKMAVLHPNETFKHGGSSLYQAVQSIISGCGLFDSGSNNSHERRQMMQIRGELHRLRSASHKRMVSPSRA